MIENWFLISCLNSVVNLNYFWYVACQSLKVHTEFPQSGFALILSAWHILYFDPFFPSSYSWLFCLCSGYSVVPYPITDQINFSVEDIPDDDEQDDPSKSPTDPSQGKLNVTELIHYVVREPDLNKKNPWNRSQSIRSETNPIQCNL